MNHQGEPILDAIAEGVWAWIQPDGSWWVNNAGVIAGSDGVVLVDTCATERRTRALLRAAAQATDGAPLAFAINTHSHGDHTYGNSLLPESTVIVGHEATRANVLTDPIIDGCPPFWNPVPHWGMITRRPPTLTIKTDLTLHSGDTRIEVCHPGYAAHTNGDLAVWLPEQRVLFAGDLLFNQVTPLLFMGSLDGAVRSLNWIADFTPEVVVPGHGPLIDADTLPSVLQTHERYYRLVGDTAHEGILKGLSPLEAARGCDLGAFASLPDAERIVLNIHREYADATEREFDLLTAFSDAIDFNGGPMATSV